MRSIQLSESGLPLLMSVSLGLFEQGKFKGLSRFANEEAGQSLKPIKLLLI